MLLVINHNVYFYNYGVGISFISSTLNILILAKINDARLIGSSRSLAE